MVFDFGAYACLPKSDIFWTTVATIIYMITEYWLGKTDKTKAGSLLEVVYNVLKVIAKALRRKPLP